MLQANSYALIRDVLPASRLGAGLGIQGAAQAVGLSVGPALGGVLTALGGWRLIFLVNVPIGVIGLALGWFLLPRSTHQDTEVADRPVRDPAAGSRSRSTPGSALVRCPAGDARLDRACAHRPRVPPRRHGGGTATASAGFGG